jgi:hypothetical protein
VAVDSEGVSVHNTGPKAWAAKIAEGKASAALDKIKVVVA